MEIPVPKKNSKLFIERFMGLQLFLCYGSTEPWKRKNQNKWVKTFLARACMAQNASNTATISSSVWKT